VCWRRAAVLAGVAALSAGAAGLALNTVAGASSGPRTTVRITQHDFGLKGRSLDFPAGTVTFEVHNQGPSTHEFNVDRTGVSDDNLPLRADGLTVDEDSPLLHRVDSLNAISDGSTQDLTVQLPQGHYVLYCNLEGHYLGGMHLSLTVR
jgi:uncharacterized cupredoxin-like copper-binding protein